MKHLKIVFGDGIEKSEYEIVSDAPDEQRIACQFAAIHRGVTNSKSTNEQSEQIGVAK
jgi:hypothetical protein